MDQHTPQSTDEITLADLGAKLKELFLEVLRFWYIPVFFGVLGMIYQAYKYYQYVPVYPARITFSVDEDEGGSSSGLTGILGQFGLGGVRPTRYNLDKILALSKSRRVIQNSLFAKVTIDEKNDFLANHVLREYKLNENEEQQQKGETPFVFTHDSLPIFTRQENENLLMIYGFIIGTPDNPKSGLMSADYDDETNIMSLDVSTTDETLSLELSKLMFESLSSYYVSKSIEKQFKTYTLVNIKRDSVLAALKSAEYQLANFRDTNRGLLMRTDQLAELRLQREIAALTAMYAEVLKNTEVADFSLKNKTPFIQVIDAPIPPIEPVRLSLIRKLIIGLAIGGVIGAALVIGRKLLGGAIPGKAVSVQ